MDRPTVELDSQGIIVADFGTLLLTPDLFRYGLMRHRELAPGRKSLVLLIGQGATSVRGEILQISGSQEVIEITTAVAIVTRGKVARVMGNLFLKIHRNPYPTRLFDSVSDAREWLLTGIK